MQPIFHHTWYCTVRRYECCSGICHILETVSRHADLFRELEEGTTHIYYTYNIQVP